MDARAALASEIFRDLGLDERWTGAVADGEDAGDGRGGLDPCELAGDEALVAMRWLSPSRCLPLEEAEQEALRADAVAALTFDKPTSRDKQRQTDLDERRLRIRALWSHSEAHLVTREASLAIPTAWQGSAAAGFLSLEAALVCLIARLAMGDGSSRGTPASAAAGAPSRQALLERLADSPASPVPWATPVTPAPSAERLATQATVPSQALWPSLPESLPGRPQSSALHTLRTITVSPRVAVVDAIAWQVMVLACFAAEIRAVLSAQKLHSDTTDSRGKTADFAPSPAAASSDASASASAAALASGASEGIRPVVIGAGSVGLAVLRLLLRTGLVHPTAAALVTRRAHARSGLSPATVHALQSSLRVRVFAVPSTPEAARAVAAAAVLDRRRRTDGEPSDQIGMIGTSSVPLTVLHGTLERCNVVVLAVPRSAMPSVVAWLAPLLPRAATLITTDPSMTPAALRATFDEARESFVEATGLPPLTRHAAPILRCSVTRTHRPHLATALQSASAPTPSTITGVTSSTTLDAGASLSDSADAGRPPSPPTPAGTPSRLPPSPTQSTLSATTSQSSLGITLSAELDSLTAGEAAVVRAAVRIADALGDAADDLSKREAALAAQAAAEAAARGEDDDSTVAPRAGPEDRHDGESKVDAEMAAAAVRANRLAEQLRRALPLAVPSPRAYRIAARAACLGLLPIAVQLAVAQLADRSTELVEELRTLATVHCGLSTAVWTTLRDVRIAASLPSARSRASLARAMIGPRLLDRSASLALPDALMRRLLRADLALLPPVASGGAEDGSVITPAGSAASHVPSMSDPASTAFSSIDVAVAAGLHAGRAVRVSARMLDDAPTVVPGLEGLAPELRSAGTDARGVFVIPTLPIESPSRVA